MKSTEPFENFTPWEESLSLNKDIYNLTRTFPEEETNGIALKLRGCTVDIAICVSRYITGRNSIKLEEKLVSAADKVFETEALLRIAHSLKYISEGDLDNLLSKTESIRQHFIFMLRRIERDKEIQ